MKKAVIFLMSMALAVFSSGQIRMYQKFDLAAKPGTVKFPKLIKQVEEHNFFDPTAYDYLLPPKDLMPILSLAIKQKLDSTIGSGIDPYSGLYWEKGEFFYDSSGHSTILNHYYKEEQAGPWILEDKTEIVHDENGNMTQMAEFFWDEINNQWIGSGKSSYTYDEEGHVISLIGYEWDDDINDFVGWIKIEYTYNDAGMQLQLLIQYWDDIGDQWLLSFKYEYSYDDYGNILSITISDWDDGGSQWINGNKIAYFYNSENQLTHTIMFSWSVELNQWVNFIKTENTYDENGNQTLNLTFEWSESINDWLFQSKYEMDYDSYGNMTLDVYYSWNNDDSLWINIWKETYEYDSYNNATVYINYIWGDDSQWKADEKTECTYDNTYAFSDLLLPETFLQYIDTPDKFSHMLLIMKSYEQDFYSGELTLYSIDYLYYSELNINSLNEITGQKPYLFPNPVVDLLSVNLPEDQKQSVFKLYDLQGRQLMSREIENSEVIDLHDLSSGMYLYNLVTENEKFSGKLVKK